jgi:L-lactate dehydrogenase
MTHLAAHFAAAYEVPASRVLGSGTTLDTARFRALLGRHLGVDAQHVHAYVVGEHGDSEVLTWSQATVAGVPLETFCRERDLPLTPEVKQFIDERVRRAAYHIISGKGATYYGIGSAVKHIVDVLLHDQRAVLTVCAQTTGVAGCDGVTLALPRLLGGAGVLATIPLVLDPDEREALTRSAAILRGAVDSLSAA